LAKNETKVVLTFLTGLSLREGLQWKAHSQLKPRRFGATIGEDLERKARPAPVQNADWRGTPKKNKILGK
jgi:hypothetical protein